MNFKSRTVLITGGAEGIGAACCAAFLKQGANVSVLDLNPPGPDDNSVCWTVGDVTDEKIRQEAVANTLARFGRTDILVNNVGIGLYSAPSATPPALAQRMFDVNVFAAVGMCNLVVPQMRMQGSGAIVNIESIGALVSLPWCSMYCATKFALRAYSRSLGHELRREGIHVLSVLPGIVDTKFRDHVLAGDAPQSVQDLKRVVSPEMIARAVLRGLASRKRSVIAPRIGIPVYLMELLTPRLIDWYIQCCWKRTSDVSTMSEPRSLRKMDESLP